MICIVEPFHRCDDVLPEVLTPLHLLVMTPLHVFHELGETVTSRSPVYSGLHVANDVGANASIKEPFGEPFCGECVRDTSLSK